MDEKKKLAIIAYTLLLKKRNKRRYWHKKWLGDYQRLKNSFTFNLEPIIFAGDDEEIKDYVRLPAVVYNMILEKIAPLLTKKPSKSRLSISPREKVSLTLSYLANGEYLKLKAFMND